jgi:O-antigen chain-terminating methyltransferase
VDKSDIPEEGTNVEEIMRKIKENIKGRRAIDISAKTGDMADRKLDETEEHAPYEARNLREMENVNSNWDIQNNNYVISSHRRIIGKALVKGRELVHGEVRRYIDPTIWKQREFNASIVRILNDMAVRIGRISARVDDKIAQSQSTISAQVDGKIAQSQSTISTQVDDKIAQSQSTISAQVDDMIAQSQSTISAQVDDMIAQSKSKISSEIGEQVKSVVAAMNEDIENRAWLAEILDGRIAKESVCASNAISESHADCINYFVFEERFRGSRADIKERQSAFIKYFKGCRNVLDIGCGRGEFQELLRDHEIGGHGIDVDEDMVNFCKSKGLDVEKIDAVSYLQNLEDKSLDGIFIDQVVEHLEQEYLIRMLNLSYMKLIYGGTIVVETVNPLSFFSFANFYIDISHKRPLHPETLRFLLNAAGFREIQIELISPVRDDARLKKIKTGERKDGRSEEIEIYNHNIDMLNAIIYGPQDYALIGIK